MGRKGRPLLHGVTAYLWASSETKERNIPNGRSCFLQGVAFTWLVTGIVLARRNHVPILVPDDRYFRSAFGQASLVVILLVSGFQLVSSMMLYRLFGVVLIHLDLPLWHRRAFDCGWLYFWVFLVGIRIVQWTTAVSTYPSLPRFHLSICYVARDNVVLLFANSFGRWTKAIVWI